MKVRPDFGETPFQIGFHFFVGVPLRWLREKDKMGRP
jgi:hypothetical protein